MIQSLWRKFHASLNHGNEGSGKDNKNNEDAKKNEVFLECVQQDQDIFEEEEELVRLAMATMNLR